MGRFVNIPKGRVAGRQGPPAELHSADTLAAQSPSDHPKSPGTLAAWRPETVPEGDYATRPEADNAAALALLDTQATDNPLDLLGLDNPDERRMQEILAARLFPKRRLPLKIGRYRILDRLGHGGMGVVYSAYDLELDRRVAIKLLLAEKLSPTAESRLRREAQAMAKVMHANVISVIEVGDHDGQTYVVMEYLRGRSLAQWRSQHHSWREILAVYVQAGRGLAAAHHAGIIHRDFKPQNAMIVDEGPDAGRVKVLDFGLARAAESAELVIPEEPSPAQVFAARLTATGALMGTPLYMAPEQLSGAPATALSDQYSFAAALYEALYAELPFKGETLAHLIRKVLDDELPPQPNTAIPTRIHRILVRALARAPEQRFESMNALCEALEHDPSARRRTFALSFALSAVVGVGAWGIGAGTAEENTLCSGPSFELAGVWDETVAADVRRAFAATDVPYADDAAARTIRLLSDYSGQWTAARRGTCEDHRAGTVSAELLDLQMACFGRRRAGLLALQGLLREADAAIVERASEAASSLPAVTACSDPKTLLGDPLRPDDPTLAARVQDVRERLAQIAAIASAGRLDTAAQAASEMTQLAESIGFLPLIAEAELRLGAIEIDRLRSDDAEHALSRAIAAGIEGDADRLTAEALFRRLFVRGVHLGDQAGAEADAKLAAPFAARFADDPRLRWLYLNNLGAIELQRGNLDNAETLLIDASAIKIGPTPIGQASTRANLGILFRERRELVTASEHFAAARHHINTHLGPEHPLTSAFIGHEANLLREFGRAQEARELLTGLLERAGNRSAHIGAWPRITLAHLEIDLRRYERARKLAETALEILDSSDVVGQINAENILAIALAGLGAFDEARGHRDHAFKLAEDRFNVTGATTISALALTSRHPSAMADRDNVIQQLRRTLAALRTKNETPDATTADLQRLLANALIQNGETSEALELTTAAIATLHGLEGDHDLDLGKTELRRGQALFAKGQPEAASDTYRRALDLLEPRLDEHSPKLAELRVAAAKAQLTSNQPGAASLLAKADAAYNILGEPFAEERAEIKTLRRRLAAG